MEEGKMSQAFRGGGGKKSWYVRNAENEEEEMRLGVKDKEGNIKLHISLSTY